MKDKELKRMLDSYIEAPDPKVKDSFLRSIKKKTEKREICFTRMLACQIGYIRWYVWLASLAVVVFAIVTAGKLEDHKLLILSEMMPFLAGLGMMEDFRARIYGMHELEGVTVFSAKGVLFAKMTIIGILHTLTVLVIVLFKGRESVGDFMYAGFNLLIPYLVTTIICMELERKEFARGEMGSCMAVALLVAILRMSLTYVEAVANISLSLLGAITLALVFIQIAEIVKTMKMEEYLWN